MESALSSNEYTQSVTRPEQITRRTVTRMTMTIGPAKLQMSLSEIEIQQKSGFP